MTVVKGDMRTYAPHVFDTHLLPLMGHRGGGLGLQTTVDPALIRGSVTVRS